MLCDNLEGWGEGRWEGVQDEGDTCIPVADSNCYMAETITILSSNYPPFKINKNKNTKFGQTQSERREWDVRCRE